MKSLSNLVTTYEHIFSHCLSMVGLQPSSSMSTSCGVLLKGDEPFFATLAQDGLSECDQPGKNPLKYPAIAGN